MFTIDIFILIWFSFQSCEIWTSPRLDFRPPCWMLISSSYFMLIWFSFYSCEIEMLMDFASTCSPPCLKVKSQHQKAFPWLFRNFISDVYVYGTSSETIGNTQMTQQISFVLLLFYLTHFTERHEQIHKKYKAEAICVL